jgi:stage III sporulation protein SpoIIIAA
VEKTFFKGKKVCVIEREVLGASFNEYPTYLGIRTDILDGCLKVKA